MDGMLLLFSLAVAYMVGALPAAVLVTRRLRGVDIRGLGTGNPGTANVYREVGPGAGIAVGLFDIAKGAVVVIITSALVGRETSAPLLAGLVGVTGHMFSPFLGFRGGAGLAPAIGAIFALMPPQMAVAFPLGFLLLLLTRNTGWASGIGFSANLALGMVGGVAGAALVGAVLLPLFVVARTFVVTWASRAGR